jgi:hypothetical protein
VAFLYNGSQVPVPITPSAPPDQFGVSDSTTTAPTFTPYQSGQSFWDPAIYNGMVAQTAAAFVAGGGYGVLSGLTLTAPGSGLLLQVNAGFISCMGARQIPITTLTIPDATSIVFIWAVQNGTVAYTTTTTPPATNCVYIGNVGTSGGNITTAPDYSGVVYAVGGVGIRSTNDIGAPTDTPNSGTSFYTITQTGMYHWNGASYNYLTSSTGGQVANITLTGDFNLLPAHNGLIFNFISSGGNHNVLMPDPSTCKPGWSVTLVNVGASNNQVIKDHTGSTTFATLTTTNVTVTPFTYMNSSSAVVFPAGPWSAGPIPVPSSAPLS